MSDTEGEVFPRSEADRQAADANPIKPGATWSEECAEKLDYAIVMLFNGIWDRKCTPLKIKAHFEGDTAMEHIGFRSFKRRQYDMRERRRKAGELAPPKSRAGKKRAAQRLQFSHG